MFEHVEMRKLVQSMRCEPAMDVRYSVREFLKDVLEEELEGEADESCSRV